MIAKVLAGGIISADFGTSYCCYLKTIPQTSYYQFIEFSHHEMFYHPSHISFPTRLCYQETTRSSRHRDEDFLVLTRRRLHLRQETYNWKTGIDLTISKSATVQLILVKI